MPSLLSVQKYENPCPFQIGKPKGIMYIRKELLPILDKLQGKQVK